MAPRVQCVARMKKIDKKALRLSTETVRHLQGADLAGVAGAMVAGPTHSCVFQCAVTDAYACSFNGGCTGIITWDGNC